MTYDYICFMQGIFRFTCILLPSFISSYIYMLLSGILFLVLEIEALLFLFLWVYW